MVNLSADIKKIVIREAKIFLVVATLGVLAFITAVYYNAHSINEFIASLISKLVGVSFCLVIFVYPLYIVARLAMWFVMRQKK